MCGLLLACLLVIGCQTTHPATKPQSGSPAQQASGQEAAGQEQGAAAQAGGASPARQAARGAGGASATKFVSAVSNQINTLFTKVKSLVKRPRSTRPSATGEKITSVFRNFRMPSTDILPTLAAAAILLGGGALVLAAILARRRRS